MIYMFLCKTHDVRIDFNLVAIAEGYAVYVCNCNCLYSIFGFEQLRNPGIRMVGIILVIGHLNRFEVGMVEYLDGSGFKENQYLIVGSGLGMGKSRYD